MSRKRKVTGTTTIDESLEKTLINNCPNIAKKLKALEIIKDKIKFEEIKSVPFKNCREYYVVLNSEALTQEEYDLLKEILTDENH